MTSDRDLGLGKRSKKLLTVIPAISVCHFTYRITADAVTSHFASEPDAHLIVLDNAPLDTKPEWTYWTDKLKDLLRRLGYEYRHYAEPWNLSRFWNKGLDIAKEERWRYVAICNADVYFHPTWFTAAVKDWEEIPVEQEIISVHPWSHVSKDATHNIRNVNYCYDDLVFRKRGLVPFDYPACHVSIFEGKTDYRFDEKYVHYHVDVDFWQWMRQHERYGALCYASRVDHLPMRGSCLWPTKPVDFSASHGLAVVDGDADLAYYQEKWGLKKELGEADAV